MTSTHAGSLRERLRTWFPDREFIMRSQGKVRFVRFSSRVQITAAAIVTALLFAWLVTMAVMIASQYIATRDRLSLLDREAKVTSAESRVATYRHGLDGVTADLQRRQDFIEKMSNAYLSDLPKEHQPGDTVSDSTDQEARAVHKISAVMPEAAPLARLEARQLAWVERLTRYADRRSAEDMERMRRLGLNPELALASLTSGEAEGGPLEALSTSANGDLDPRFERLGVSLARMSALDHGLDGLPQVMPANLQYISSGFGYRSDPFTGHGAFHPGLDFAGPLGAPIYAAARGTVSFAGVMQGYGNCIEVSHGNGVVTRYGHMSAIRAHLGQTVAAGQVIGAIGSTGRSTGPHLHFEVRINDRPVNPRPFLDAAGAFGQTQRNVAVAD